MTTATRIGIDLGGTKTRMVMVNEDGHVLRTASRRTADYGSGTAAAVALAFDIRKLVGAIGPEFIGVGASGPILPDGTIANPDTLPGFSGINLAEHLQKAMGAPCRVENDALAAALGEWTYGAGRGAVRLLMITLGTGIGVAVVNAGTPYLGTDGISPEAGHIPVTGGSAPCYCGLATCWEQIASRASLQCLAIAALSADGVELGPQEAVSHLAARPEAHDVFTTFGQRVALGLKTLLVVHRPDVVVLGGSGAEHFDLIEPGIRADLAGRPAYVAPFLLRAAGLGDLGGAIGAVCLGAPAPAKESIR